MKVDTTYSNNKTEEITLDSIKKAVAVIEPLKPKFMYICHKHWKALKKELAVKDNSNPVLYPALIGINVVIKPYLKKVWITKD